MADEEQPPPPPPPQQQQQFVGIIGAAPSFAGGNSDDWEVFKLTLDYFFSANAIQDEERKKGYFIYSTR
jgi:hypothetical protein